MPDAFKTNFKISIFLVLDIAPSGLKSSANNFYFILLKNINNSEN